MTTGPILIKTVALDETFNLSFISRFADLLNDKITNYLNYSFHSLERHKTKLIKKGCNKNIKIDVLCALRQIIG